MQKTTKSLVRTAVFIGRTGSGVSACANTLAGKDLFQESHGTYSMTRNVEVHTVALTWQEQQYEVKIVDTIGIGHTELPPDEVLKRLACVCNECREGINAVYFVIGGRFTDEEAEAWHALWRVLFGPEVLEYVTLVLTKFRKFRDPEAVRLNSEELNQDEVAARTIMSCVKDIICVDNPPPEYGGSLVRPQSQNLLLSHLIAAHKVFKPPELDQVNQRIADHLLVQRETGGRQEVLETQMRTARRELEGIDSSRS